MLTTPSDRTTAPVADPATGSTLTAPARPDRFYVAVRADLDHGAQLAQAIHAALAFTFDHPAPAEDWYRNSEYLVVVTVADEPALRALADKARSKGIATSLFVEPDFDDAATAAAFAPGPAARKLCANLPLAGRRPRLT